MRSSPPRNLGLCLLMLAVATIVHGSTEVMAALAGFRIAPSPNVPAQLDGVASSGGEAWAVGFRSTATGPPRTVVEHWNGFAWGLRTAAALPAGDDARLHGVAIVTTNLVWAVGSDTPARSVGHSLIEQWNGTAWSIVPSPATEPAGSELLAVAAVSARDVWAVGDANAGGSFQTLIEHWDGTRWAVIPGAPILATGHDFLTGVAGSGAQDVWAVGRTSRHPVPLVEHWNGSSWSTTTQPVSGYDSSLWSVAVISGADAWAVGSQNLNQTVTEHWDGATWSLVPSPFPSTGNAQNTLQSVAALGHRDVWAVGRTLANFSQDRTLAEHWDGATWRLVSTPNPDTQSFLNATAGSVAGAPLWGVGGTSSSSLVVVATG